MKHPSLLHPGWPLIGASLVFGAGAVGVTRKQAPPPVKPTADQVTFFETKIRPVLVANCFSCHGKDAQLSGLRLDSAAAILKGGDTGSDVVPGDPAKSLLIKAIHQSGNLKMPPGGKQLKPNEIADFEAWIKMGAPWPDGASTGKGPQYAPLWSLEPIKSPAIPKVKLKGWVSNPIDSFVLAKLEANKLKPAPGVDRRTLLRRVTYDLTGLPATAEETDAFLADKTPKAYEKVVDRLLASPQYGERWARQWMDVARYADTKGYVFEEDRNYYSAYTYRNWVIDAFNRDLPYDKFILQQLAADRLPEVQSSDDKRPLAALGFLTLGRRFINSVPDIIDDRIDVTMRGFEGFTVGCARCHDHKFDPIPTQDYYSLYAIFNSSEEKQAPISDKAIRDPWAQNNERISTTETTIRNLVVSQVKELRQQVANPERAKGLSNEVKASLMSIREENVPEGDLLRKIANGFPEEERNRLQRLQADVAELKKNAPPTPEFAMAMQDNPHPSDGVVFKRGNPGNHGDPAPRRFLLALSKPGVERPHWTSDSGRLELAESIASKDNPLTARVFVNRVWQSHFGAGIVRTPSDFGHQGEKPTDPQLLDYLASTFMENGWSIKRLQKQIVMSATYRQSCDVPDAVVNADPDNRLWGRMNRRRLDMEEMRDSLMAAAGKLDLKQVGGKSVDIWSAPFAERRAVYGFVERQNLPGVFRTFDFASPDSTSARRFTTTVPQQALFFMNSPLAVEEARALASRTEIKDASDDAQRVRRLYRDLFARLPDAQETSLGLSFMRGGSEKEVARPDSVWQYGYGKFDADHNRVEGFTPLTHYSNDGYHVGDKFPDPTLGYIVINKNGGHPGHDAAHSAIRRWVAPADMTVRVLGVIHHHQKEGDGVRGIIVTSSGGKLGEWKVHNSQARTDVGPFTVKKGDTVDFVIDPQTNDGYDATEWAPKIRTEDASQIWDAAKNFSAPPPPPLSRLALYAQVLMMSNEFMFVD